MPSFIYDPEEHKQFKIVKLPKPLQDFIDSPPPKGSRNTALFAAACQARDLGWDEAQTEATLIPPSLRVELTESDARKTIHSAYTQSKRDPAGRGNVPYGTTYGTAASHAGRSYSKNMKKEVVYDLTPGFALPEPMANGAAKLIEHLFNSGERIYFNRAVLDDDGERETVSVKPDHQRLWTREILLKNLGIERVNGDPAKLFGGDGSHGVYFCVNPLGKTNDSRKADNVADLRYGLIEFDALPVEEQFQIILQSKIPCVAITFSGGKSVHAIVSVDAGLDQALYKARMLAYMEHFRAYGVDPHTKDPSRLSRLPGALREDTQKSQQLLTLNVGCPSYEEWERELMVEQDGLPALEDVFDLVEQVNAGTLVEPEEVIKGIAHVGCKLVLAAGSKNRKTWALADLAASVIGGGLWLDHLQCNKGRVLYLNMELPRYFMTKRIMMILAAKGLTIEKDQLITFNLRGFAAHLAELRPQIEHAIENQKFSLIILDPTYKLMPGGDESGTSDSSILLNQIEKLAVKSGALAAFASHYSKGNQSQKNSIDRISGSGVFARDPDTIITMTEHAADTLETPCLSVDPILRNHKPVEPFVIKWEFPLFKIDSELDPAKLKGEPPKHPKKEKEDEGLILPPGQKAKIQEWCAANLPGSEGNSKGKFVDHLAKVFKVSESTAEKRLKSLMEMDLIKETLQSDSKVGTKNYEWNPNPNPKTNSETESELPEF